MLRSARAVGVITLVSRVTGLLRDAVRAHFLGTGAVADAFVLALQVPNLLRRLVGEGAVQSGVVPVLARVVHEEGREAMRALTERLYTLWTLALLAVTLAGIVLSGALLGQALEGLSDWSPEKARLTVELNRWLFIYLFFIGLSALGQGVLNSFKVFALPAATPLLFNLCFIAAGLLFPLFFANTEETAAWAFTAGVLVGGLLQFAVLVPSLWKRGVRFRPRWRRADGDGHRGVREVFRLLLPATVGAGVYQINVMVSVFIASTVMGGAVSSLNHSGRVVEVILGVYVFALSTVSLTTLSQKAGAGDLDGYRDTASEVLRLVLFITVPSAIGLLVLRRPIVEVLFASGRFDDTSVELTVEALECHAPGLVFVGVSRELVTMFHAFKDTRTPMRVAVLNLVLNAVLCVLLSRTALRHAGVALASTLSVVVQAVALWWIFQRRRALIDMRGVAVSVGRALVAASVMGLACRAGLELLPADAGRLGLGAFVAIEVAGGAAIYFAVARLLRAPEVGVLLGRRRS